MKKFAIFIVAVFALLLGACSTGTGDTNEPEKVEDVNLTVFAAASLKSPDLPISLRKSKTAHLLTSLLRRM